VKDELRVLSLLFIVIKRLFFKFNVSHSIKIGRTSGSAVRKRVCNISPYSGLWKGS